MMLMWNHTNMEMTVPCSGQAFPELDGAVRCSGQAFPERDGAVTCPGQAFPKEEPMGRGWFGLHS